MNKFKYYYEQLEMLKKQYEAEETEEGKEGVRTSVRNIQNQIQEEGQTFVRIFNQYETARDNGNKDLDLSEAIWDKDVPGIMECLKKNGIKQFTYSSTWSGAVETAWLLTENGCQLKGMQIINSTYDRFEEKQETKPAYVFRIRKQQEAGKEE